MIMINNNWEQVNDLTDIIRIISESICEEFAKKIEDIIGTYESEIEELENQISEYESDDMQLEFINSQLERLKRYIDCNKDGTDYMRGVEYAYEMIERSIL